MSSEKILFTLLMRVPISPHSPQHLLAIFSPFFYSPSSKHEVGSHCGFALCFLIANGVEQLSTCFLAICISSWEKCLFKYFVCFLIRLLKLLSYKNSLLLLGFPGGSAVKNLPAKAEDGGLIPGSGRSFGEGNGNPLHYSCLESQAQRSLAAHGVAKNWRQLSD